MTGTLSGWGVGAAGAGGLLIYAGLTGQSPLVALRSVLSGRPAGLPASTPAPGAPAGGTVTPNPTASGHAAGASYSALASQALKHVGTPYRWGGNTAAGVDCSGLVQLAFRELGVTDCPRTTYQQVLWSKIYRISRAEVAAGDLVYWTGHVVIATSNTMAVAAQSAGTLVKTLPISSAHTGVPIGYFRYGTRPTHTQN